MVAAQQQWFDMSPDESFESAEYLVAWARAELDEFKALLGAFHVNDPGSVVEEINEETGYRDIKIKFPPLPFKFRGLCSNIVKNLRDALDQVVHASTLHVAGKHKRNAHFAFGTDPDDFEDALTKGPCKDIPHQLYPILRRYEPYPTGEGYPGGDNVLRLLGKISGSHKHRTTLIVTADATNVELSPKMIRGRAVLFPFLSGRPKQDELVLFSLGEGTHAELEFKATTYVAFAEPNLRNIHAEAFLEACHAKVMHIVQDMRAEVLKLARGISPISH